MIPSQRIIHAAIKDHREAIARGEDPNTLLCKLIGMTDTGSSGVESKLSEEELLAAAVVLQNAG